MGSSAPAVENRPARERPLALLLTLLLVACVSPATATIARAQPAVWECQAPAAPAAESTGGTPVRSEVSSTAFPAEGGNLTVFAAASLTDAFEEMKANLEAAHPGLTITYNFGGSQALVTQLTEGAAADVFASAHTAQMTAAVEAGVIAGEPLPFVQNRLAIVAPAENPAAVSHDAGGSTSSAESRPASPRPPAPADSS